MEFLDREISNLTIHAMAQAAAIMKEPDDKKEFFGLEIDVAEKSAGKTSYNIPRWLLEVPMDHFVTVWSHILNRDE